jgi:hypothetical protein
MDTDIDTNERLELDGNATAGILYEIFARDMTDCPAECAHCGRRGELGSLLAFTQAPGIVLRCPACTNVVLRVVRAPAGIYLEMRGLAYLCLRHVSA